eukprot:TRINITY_DN73008_c0_g1_i1.p2 TRINITY_DN73008_c0_g1~~TRINITY_DN73008_c0_g1_i1.p2  ORF type:complete len:202 (+),score=83.26 TRINITY_DN73008_c0_g1_i1:79-606(+)
MGVARQRDTKEAREGYNASGAVVGSDDETDEEEDVRRSKTIFTRIKDLIWTLLWIAASGFAAHRSDIVGVLLHSQSARRWALYSAFSLMAVTVVICVWLTYSYDSALFDEVVCTRLPGKPKAIPLATICWVLGSCFMTYALWPVYHVLTMPLLMLFLMGFINCIALIPGGRKKKD